MVIAANPGHHVPMERDQQVALGKSGLAVAAISVVVPVHRMPLEDLPTLGEIGAATIRPVQHPDTNF